MSTSNITQFLTSSKNFNELLSPKTLDIQGFASGQLYTLFGRPKEGKTTICVDTALNAIKLGAKVLYVDGDMGGLNLVRLNEILTNRKSEEGMPPPLPATVFKNNPETVKNTFAKHLAKYGLFLYIAKSIEHFKKFHFMLSNKPDLVIIDSATLFFRQEQIQGMKKFGSGVRTVDFAATTVRQYCNNSLAPQFPAPNGAACGILTAQTKSEISAVARQQFISERLKEGKEIPLRERQVSRPFVGGEGLGYLSETFIEILRDDTDKYGKRRIATIWGSRNLQDKKQCNFQTTDKGIADV